MKFAYADPPYLGLAALYPEKREVDHPALIQYLSDEYPDGWALSTHSPGLKIILPLCPVDIRVGAWVKPWCSFKPGVHVAYAWEPVLFRGGRKFNKRDMTVRDWIAANATRGRDMIGAKPDEFSFWLFRMLNMNPDDELHDLFPGSGAVMRAWKVYRRQLTLQLRSPSA